MLCSYDKCSICVQAKTKSKLMRVLTVVSVRQRQPYMYRLSSLFDELCLWFSKIGILRRKQIFYDGF